MEIIFAFDLKKPLFTKDNKFPISIEREINFPKYIGKIYLRDELILEVSGLSFIKIIYQNLQKYIEVKSNNYLSTTFSIEGDIVKVKNNFFYFLYGQPLARLYYNAELAATVTQKKLFPIDQPSILIVDFKTEDEDLQFYLILCLLSTQLWLDYSEAWIAPSK